MPITVTNHKVESLVKITSDVTTDKDKLSQYEKTTLRISVWHPSSLISMSR